MADILIKNMEMPKEGCHHTLSIYADGSVEIGSKNNYMAIELPPHGRLIDADAFKAYLLEWLMKFVTHPNFLEAKKMTEGFFRDIDEAPTVLEAST